MRKKLKIEIKKNKTIKKTREDKIKQPRHKHIHWACIKCGKIRDILISPRNEHLYTKEREKKHICVMCK